MPWAKGILFFTMAVMTLSTYGAVSEKTVSFGKVLIGGQSLVSHSDVKTSMLSSVESDGHQPNEGVRFLPAKAKLQRLGSSVQCGNDSMILRISGPKMPHFLVDRGEESPVPLSEMPASCGFSLKRVRRDVSLVAPYRGCHVKQQGGNYILPLIIMGAPVRMSCPVSLPTVSCFSTGMIATLGVRGDDVKVLVDGSWQPLLLTHTQCSFTLENNDGSLVVTAPFTGSCWLMTDTEMQLPLMYGDREVTLSCPLTWPTIAPTMPADPFPLGRPWWYPPYRGVPATLPPTVPPTTTTTTPPPLPYPFQQHMFPQMYPRPVFDPYYSSRGDPAAPPAPQRPQYPWYPNLSPYMNGFQSPVEMTTPTTPATTTTTPAPYQHVQYPMFPPLPINPYLPPAPAYPFMPKYPVFGPRSSKSMSSPAQLSSAYRPRR